MSIQITTDVFCDQCSAWGHHSTGRKADVAGAKAAAKQDGWTFQRVAGREKSACPVCNKSEPGYWNKFSRIEGKSYAINI